MLSLIAVGKKEKGNLNCYRELTQTKGELLNAVCNRPDKNGETMLHIACR